VKNYSESSLLLMRYKHCITESTLPWTSMIVVGGCINYSVTS